MPGYSGSYKQQFYPGYFHSRPFTTDLLHEATFFTFGEDGHVPDTDNIADMLSINQLVFFREAWKAKDQDRIFGRKIVSSFLKLYRGQPVGTVKPWRTSTGWTFLYFLEKWFRLGDENAKAIRRTLKKKEKVDAKIVENFVRTVFECVGNSNLVQLLKTLRSPTFRDEALFMIGDDKQAYFDELAGPIERSMKYFFKSMLGFPIHTATKKMSKPFISTRSKTPLRSSLGQTHSKATAKVEREIYNMEVDELPQEENAERETSSAVRITSDQETIVVIDDSEDDAATLDPPGENGVIANIPLENRQL